MKTKKNKTNTDTHARKTWLVFFCGVVITLLIGIFVGRTIIDFEPGGLPKATCRNINSEITALKNMGINESSVNKLRELTAIYSEQCRGRIFKIANLRRAPEKTCEVIERKMLGKITDERQSDDPYAFIQNAEIYSDLMTQGCPENTETFRQLAIRQLEIATVLYGEIVERNIHDEFHRIRLHIYMNVKGLDEVAAEARRLYGIARRIGGAAVGFAAEVERILTDSPNSPEWPKFDNAIMFGSDGCLTPDMMKGNEADLPCLDTNNDGCVTREEWDAFHNYWKHHTPEPEISLCEQKLANEARR